ncbi:MAG: tail-specific protease precursor [Chitinophagaceae bacterium]|nr:tail-specific protease precursor [Chitinophagaceae bacterium]
MMSKKGLPIVGVLLLVCLFFGFRSNGNDGSDPVRQEKILKSVAALLKDKHYSPKNINDAFSKIVFKQYLKDLDPEKNIFLQSDINTLRKFENSIDDEINKGQVQFFHEVNALYEKRMPEVVALYKEILAQPFDFSVNEKIQLDLDKIQFASNEAARKEVWRKRLKYLALERYADLLDQRDKDKSKDSVAPKTDAQLELDARQRVLKAMDRNFDRLKVRFTADERFNMYINAISESMDPYTSYFPPIEKRAFDEQMSGRFYGIGAQLRDEDGVIKVVSLVTGSPAWKSGEIQVNDIILKVAQGNAEPTDLAGFAVEDAVKLIRGSKGAEVRLTIKKSDGSVKVVALIRDEIIQDEIYARSAIVNQNGNKIGYIYLPEFYADFEKPNGNRSSSDVAAEIVKLKAEKVDGIVLDLRNNGGGFLYEVVKMVGLFIKDGPVVQVRDRDGKSSVLEDEDQTVLYDGPLAVMVNELSASASEIFAAAIQDYKRGIIIGSNSTYGKGTVQRSIPFGGRPMDFFTGGGDDLGALKLTLQKYYRVNGGSTQLKGVVPDVIIPDVYQFLKIREKDNDNALPWDEIKNSTYQTWNSNIDYNAVKRVAEARINSNTVFTTIHKNAEWLSKNADKEYDLNLAKYRERQKQIRSTVRENDTLTKLNNELDVASLQADQKKFFNNDDKAKGERYQQWLKSLKSDIYIDEASKVIGDMISSAKGLAFNK